MQTGISGAPTEHGQSVAELEGSGDCSEIISVWYAPLVGVGYVPAGFLVIETQSTVYQIEVLI